MVEYVFLIRNGELYNIGRTNNLEMIQKKLAPGILIASLKTQESKEILRILQSEFSEQRIPQSDYFRLNKSQFLDCKKKLETSRTKDDFKPFFSGLNLALTFIAVWVAISIAIISILIRPIFDQFN